MDSHEPAKLVELYSLEYQQKLTPYLFKLTYKTSFNILSYLIVILLTEEISIRLVCFATRIFQLAILTMSLFRIPHVGMFHDVIGISLPDIHSTHPIIYLLFLLDRYVFLLFQYFVITILYIEL